MPDAARDLRADSPKQYEASQSTWDSIAESQEFQDLMATKKIFIVPAFIFFVVYYFALPVLVGYAPEFMSTKVIGPVNLAYLFALSQFFVAWIIAGLYVKAADNFDRLAKDILEQGRGCEGRQVSHVEYSTDHVSGIHCDHAGHYLLGVEAIGGGERVLCGEPADQGLAERNRGGRRLHERGVVSGDRGDHRVSGIRRIHVFGGMAGGVSDGAAGDRGTVAQCGQVHDGGCAGIPAEAAAGAGDGVAEHADGEHVLHDRADGGRGRAGETAAGRHRSPTTRR